MELYNKSMSKVRVAVKMLFGNISKYFKFIDFKRQMKVNLSLFFMVVFLSKLPGKDFILKRLTTLGQLKKVLGKDFVFAKINLCTCSKCCAFLNQILTFYLL